MLTSGATAHHNYVWNHSVYGAKVPVLNSDATKLTALTRLLSSKSVLRLSGRGKLSQQQDLDMDSFGMGKSRYLTAGAPRMFSAERDSQHMLLSSS